MKSQIIILAAVAGSLAIPAFGQGVELTLTGSTAFRSVVTNRVLSLYSTGTFYRKDGNTFSFIGTMPSVFPSSPTKQIRIHMSYTGSATGMQNVKDQTLIGSVDWDGTTSTATNYTPDIAMSDVFPSSATPPMSDSDFAQRDIVGVVPFVFVKNGTGATLSGVTGLTREQAVLLMTASGNMPATYLGGTSANPIYLAGRDSGSGTRITTERVIGFVGTPFLTTNGPSAGPVTNVGPASGLFYGYNSGGTLATQIKTNDAVIGYLGLPDFASISNSAVALTYEGVAYASTNVTGGKYPIWGYEHIVSRSGLSADQQTLRDAIVSAISDNTFQHNDVNYVGRFEALSDMQVKRGADGGPILSKKF